MSLFDKESDASKSLRLLVIGGRQDIIGLTQEDSPFLVDHKPSLCSECKAWYDEVRTIERAHYDLFDRDGYLTGSSFSALTIGQNQRLEEIGRLVGEHLQKVYHQELEKKMKEAG